MVKKGGGSKAPDLVIAIDTFWIPQGDGNPALAVLSHSSSTQITEDNAIKKDLPTFLYKSTMNM